MADANLNIILKVVTDAAGQISKVAGQLEGLQQAATQANKTNAGMASSLSAITGSLGGMSRGFGLAFAGVKLLAGGWLALKQLQMVKHFAEAAGEAEALARGLEAVGRSAGYSEEQLKGAVEEMEKLGVSSTAAQKNLNRLITSNVGLGTATDLAASAQKIAGSLGRSTEEVFNTIAQSVSQGTTRLLRRQFGIVLNEQLVFQKKAQELGRELFQDEKREALANALNELAKARFSQGNVEETLSQKQDQLRVSTDRLTETIGKIFLPFWKEAIGMTTILTDRLQVMVQKFIDARNAGKDFVDSLDEAAFGDESDKNNKALVTATNKLLDAENALLQKRREIADVEARGLSETAITLKKQQLAQIQADLDSAKAIAAALTAERQFRAETEKEVAKLLARAPKEPPKPKPEAIPDPQRVEEERQRKAEVAKIRAEGAVKGAEAILNAVKLANQAIEIEDKRASDQGILNLEEYFSRRRARIDSETNAEIERAKAQLAAAQQALQERVSKIYDPALTKQTLQQTIGADPKALAAQQAVTAAREQLKNKEQEKGIKLKENDIALSTKQEDAERRVLDVAIESALARNDLDKAAAAGQILLKYNDLLKGLGLLNDEELTAEQLTQRKTILQRQSIELAKSDLEIQQKAQSIELARSRQSLDLLSARVSLAEKGGAITENEAQNRQNVLINRRIELNNEEIRQNEARLVQMRESSVARAEDIRAAEDQIVKLQASSAELAKTITTVGEGLRRDFAGSLTTFFDGLIQRTTTLREALLNFAKSIIATLSQTISKELAANITSGIVNATGGANGIFGAIGAAISGETAGKAAQDQAFLAAKEVQDNIFLAESEFQDEAFLVEYGLENEGLLFGLGAEFEIFLAELASVLAASNASAAASSGAGAAIFAAGGPIRGSSHLGGGVMINAEGGEYVVNKSATRKWGKLLDAINFGGRAPSMRSKGGSFAEGGPVAGGGSQVNNTEINISIQDNEVAASGNSEKAAQFAKLAGAMVQDELVKQKRPGGLLYNEK